MPGAPAVPRAEAGGFFKDFFLSMCAHKWRLDEGILKLEVQVSYPRWV